jgi:hypothetical protein
MACSSLHNGCMLCPVLVLNFKSGSNTLVISSENDEVIVCTPTSFRGQLSTHGSPSRGLAPGRGVLAPCVTQLHSTFGSSRNSMSQWQNAYAAITNSALAIEHNDRQMHNNSQSQTHSHTRDAITGHNRSQ